MTAELDTLRAHFGKFLLLLLWAHVPALAIVAIQAGHSPFPAALAGAVLAGAYHLTWWKNGIAPSTRYLSAVALIGEPALMLFLMSGHPWQMDMHMYFFAMLALTIAWCDWRAIIMAATVVALHHLLLLYLLPAAVFPAEGNLERVLLHAAIVAFQTAVLVWISNKLVESFDRIGRMSDEILVKNTALEERTREAEEASRAKSLFLANMSHEIRTPMNAILGFCHLVARSELTPKQRDHISKINESGVSLLRLLNDILDFSKNEAGKLTLEARPFDLRAAVANQLHLVGVDAEEKGIALEVQISPAIPKSLIGDELRFNQVVLNLLSNAVKFTESGTVTLRADVAASRDREVTLELSISDTGIGMTAEQQARLFSSFAQADNSTTRRFGGTGLGLAICRQIVEQMGGMIRVESKPGSGSVFTFQIKVSVDELGRQGHRLPPPEIQALRILAADDNPAARQIIHEIFASWNMGVDLVASGHEALGAVATADAAGKPYDLILLDWKMPGMDGMETVKAMRAQGRVPITLMVTAYCADEFVQEAKKADISAFLPKPVDPVMLLDTIRDLFAAQTQVVASQPQAPEEVAPVPRVAPSLRGLTVLVVDDNEINREIAEELLVDAGLKVVCAENGRAACSLMMENGAAYAGVLMDVQMPEMDGIEATRHIRQSWPKDRLPIIAMTAHAYEEEKQRCFAAGMNDHIAKPVSPAELVEKLDQWLSPPARKSPSMKQASHPVEAELPRSLPPFDIHAALGRVNGKAGLLRKLIISFGQTYATAASDLRARTLAGEIQDARRLAHSLKGVAGSLEIAGLQAAAGRVETLLAADACIEALREIAELERVLAPAIVAARSLGNGEGAVSSAPASQPGKVAAGEALDELRLSLRRRSLGAKTAFLKYGAAAGLSSSECAVHPVMQAIERLDYLSALGLLGEEGDGTVPSENSKDESAA